MIQYEGTNSSMSSSFVIIPTTDADNIDDDSIEVARMYSSSEGFELFDRDTSDTSRDFELNNTRDNVSNRQEITVVNTHDSILDIDSQCDEDASFSDEDENMLLGIINEVPSSPSSSTPMDEMVKSRPVSPTPSRQSKPHREKTERKNDETHANDVRDRKQQKTSSIMDSLTLYSVTDSFVDSICTSTACVPSKNYENYNNCAKPSINNNRSAMAAMDDKIKKFQESCHSAVLNGCDTDQYSPWKQTENSSKAMVSMDIWQLLGCSSPVGNLELADIWSIRTSEMFRNGTDSKNVRENKLPVRASIKKRLKRIHRLRMDDRCVRGASRHGVTITNHGTDSAHYNLNSIRKGFHMKKNNASNTLEIKTRINSTHMDYLNRKSSGSKQASYRGIGKSYSMLDDSLADFIGQGTVEPIPFENEDDGYDSDPEINCYSASSSMITDSPKRSQAKRVDDPSSISSFDSPEYPQHSVVPAVSPLPSSDRNVLRQDSVPMDEIDMRESVQQTLNSTWTLTWHPNAENRKEYNISHNKPICINMWLERGTVITTSGVVIEPAFMWRDAYQPLLLSQHKLNNSTQKPWSMRLLNACRIIPYLSSSSRSHASIDRSKYPMARQNASFLLKSCGGEEFLLEAKGTEDAIAITERWKLVVARFACLAVTEDVGGIAREFFHPTCSDSKMLTISNLHDDDPLDHSHCGTDEDGLFNRVRLAES